MPTFGAIEEGEQVFLPPRASEIDVGVPPAHRLCDTAHDAWRESVERLAQLEAEADASVGTDDPIPDIHSRMLNEARDSMNAYRAIYEECLTANPDEVPQAPPSTAAPGPSIATRTGWSRSIASISRAICCSSAVRGMARECTRSACQVHGKSVARGRGCGYNSAHGYTIYCIGKFCRVHSRVPYLRALVGEQSVRTARQQGHTGASA